MKNTWRWKTHDFFPQSPLAVTNRDCEWTPEFDPACPFHRNPEAPWSLPHCLHPKFTTPGTLGAFVTLGKEPPSLLLCCKVDHTVLSCLLWSLKGKVPLIVWNMFQGNKTVITIIFFSILTLLQTFPNVFQRMWLSEVTNYLWSSRISISILILQRREHRSYLPKTIHLPKDPGVGHSSPDS